MTFHNKQFLSENMEQGLGPFELFGVGWKLMLSEAFWSFKRACRCWEIRQLGKRLDQEDIRLGRLIRKKVQENRSGLDIRDPEIDLALGQVDLLKEEIAYLNMQMQAEREIFVENRKQKYLKNKA